MQVQDRAKLGNKYKISLAITGINSEK